MKLGPLLIVLATVAGCTATPPREDELRDAASRLGVDAADISLAQSCAYALALPGDTHADFVSGATCLVLVDRLILLRSGLKAIENPPPVVYSYRTLDGVSLVTWVKRKQLQLKIGGQLVLVELESGLKVDAAAQERTFEIMRHGGVGEFSGVIVKPRSRGPIVLAIPVS